MFKWKQTANKIENHYHGVNLYKCVCVLACVHIGQSFFQKITAKMINSNIYFTYSHCWKDKQWNKFENYFKICGDITVLVKYSLCESFALSRMEKKVSL